MNDVHGHRHTEADDKFLLSPTDDRLAIWSSDGLTVNVFRLDNDTGALVRLIEGHPAPAPRDLVVNTPVFSPDGRLLLADDLASTRAWKVATGAPRYVVNNPDAKLSPDGTVLAACDGNASHVAVWSAASGKLLTTIPLSDGQVAFADGGAGIVSGSTKDGMLRVYDCDVCGSPDHLRALARERLGR